MQVFLNIDDIGRRAKEIGYPVNELARAAGVHETTIYRSLGRDSNNSMQTMRKLMAALTAREIELRDYLLALHPLAAAAQLEAAE